MVYVCNLDGIQIPGVIPWENLHQWQELPPEAVLVVDEAQRYFCARRGNIAPLDSITAMETIRHEGVCIVMTTQQLTYLDKHVRGLIGKHIHLVRNYGYEFVNFFEFRECYDDIQSPTFCDNAQFSVWLYLKGNYKKYIFVETHTVIRKMFLKLKLGIAAGVVALGIGGYVMFGLMGLLDSRDYSKGVPQDA